MFNQNFWYIVAYKAKGRITKRMFEENKARQIFRKTSISYPMMRTRTQCLFFQKIWRALFSWITSFAFWDSSFCLITDKISIMVILGWDNSDKTYLFKVYARNTIKRCEIWSKLTIKTPERHAIPPENVRKPKV